MDYEVKADALEDSFDAVVMAAERPVLAASSDLQVASGFEAFVRSGVAMERKSFNGGTGAEGGYAVPREIDARIDDTLKTISPIRRIANVVKVGSAGYRKLVAQGGVASGWVSETAARTETGTPVFAEIAPAMGELYANPAASQAMLDDAAFDVEEWLSGEIATEFARAEGAAFVSGNGTNKPKGFLNYATANTLDGKPVMIRLAKLLGAVATLTVATAATATTTFAASGPLVTDHDAGNPVNLGNVFTVNGNYKATSLGFYTPTNLVGGGETVGLYDMAGTLLASTFVNVAANTPGQYFFQAISPVQLFAGQQYVVVNQVGQNAWAYGSVTATRATFDYNAYGYGGALAFPTNSGGSGPAYLGGNLTLSVPEPASWALMIGGFGLVGAATRRRRAVAVA